MHTLYTFKLDTHILNLNNQHHKVSTSLAFNVQAFKWLFEILFGYLRTFFAQDTLKTDDTNFHFLG